MDKLSLFPVQATPIADYFPSTFFGKCFPSLVATAGLLLCLNASGQQFTDVSVAAGLHREPIRSWGNPLWGELNNDGLLDLLVLTTKRPVEPKEVFFPTFTSTTATALFPT